MNRKLLINVFVAAMYIAELAQAQAAEVLLDIAAKSGDETVSSTKVTVVLDKATDVLVGSYKLKITPSLVDGNTVVRLTVQLVDSSGSLRSTVTREKVGEVSRVFHGMGGNQEIQIRSRLK